MWSTVLFAIALLAPAAAKLSCPDLSKFEITCSADGFDGTGEIGKKGKPKVTGQAESSLTSLFASENECTALMERMYVDSKGKENTYLVSCFSEMDEDEGRLVCNNHGFKRDGSVHMEIHWEADSEDAHILGTSSGDTFMEAWTDECKLVK
jgi:hypothetical protein